MVEKNTFSHEKEFESSLMYFKDDELAARVWVSKVDEHKSFGNIYKKLSKDNHYCITNLIEYNDAEYSRTLSNMEQSTFGINQINKSKLMSFIPLGGLFTWICYAFKNDLIDYSPFKGLFIDIVYWLVILFVIISILSNITVATNNLLVGIKEVKKNLSRSRNKKRKTRIFQTRT
jgi:hypothetical protein